MSECSLLGFSLFAQILIHRCLCRHEGIVGIGNKADEEPFVFFVHPSSGLQ